MATNDQFKQARLPLKPMPLKFKDRAECNEILIDYISQIDGREPSYDIYIVDSKDRTKLINISRLIKDSFKGVSGDKIEITLGDNVTVELLRDVLLRILYSYLYPDNKLGFKYDRDIDKVFDGIPILIKDINENIYLPVTTADNVYDSNGYTIQDRLEKLTRVAFSSETVEATHATNGNIYYDGYEVQGTFTITYPFPNYFGAVEGNVSTIYNGPEFLEVRVGSVLLDKCRYYVVNDEPINGEILTGTIHIINEEDYIEVGASLNILYIYNIGILYDGESDPYTSISGGCIANGTVRIGALERFSHDFTYDDPTSLATSKALHDLYVELCGAINSWSPANIYVKDTSTVANTIITTTDSSNYIPRDGYKVNVKLASSKNIDTDLSISIDGRSYRIIFDNDDTPDILANGSMLKLTYSRFENAFHTYALDDFRISRSYISRTLNDKDTKISYVGLYSDAIHDDVVVYRNGVRLFEGLDYSVNDDDSITLNVIGEANERIVFERLEVIPRQRR